MSFDPARATWRKSSHSGANGSCVEVAWRKSSHSNTNGACVEVADSLPQVGVRDSKDTSGPVLTFERGQWTVFLAEVKSSRLG